MFLSSEHVLSSGICWIVVDDCSSDCRSWAAVVPNTYLLLLLLQVGHAFRLMTVFQTADHAQDWVPCLAENQLFCLLSSERLVSSGTRWTAADDCTSGCKNPGLLSCLWKHAPSASAGRSHIEAVTMPNVSADSAPARESSEGSMLWWTIRLCSTGVPDR